MSENVVLLIANILVIVAWVGTALFVGNYAIRSPWRSSVVGRTLMYAKISMLTLLTYALTARWLQPFDELNYALGLGAYAFIAAMQWRLFLTLRYVQKGLVTQENPNYTPFKNWLRNRRKKENDNG